MIEATIHLRRCMMLFMIWFIALICSIGSVSSVSPTITSWVPTASAPLTLTCPSRKRTSSSFSLLNLAAQDNILDGLPWGDKSTKNDQTNNDNGTNGNNSKSVPYIIQRIGRGTKSDIEQIANMCIDVFFNEQEDVKIDADGKKQTAPWKALQLAYLRNSQSGEMVGRNAFRKNSKVDLIVARRVYTVDDASNINGNKANIIEDVSQIYNRDQLLKMNGNTAAAAYIAGELIGYCEVAEKRFGLGTNFGSSSSAAASNKQKEQGSSSAVASNNKKKEQRPYLSNLSVVQSARQSGVGSKLLDAGEDAVRKWDAGHTEIVLQVEEDNTSAIQFYKRRGWEFVFADPTGRRYDTSGFFLKESRITKYAMIKRLDTAPKNNGDGANGRGNYSGTSLMEKLKNSFFVQ